LKGILLGAMGLHPSFLDIAFCEQASVCYRQTMFVGLFG
jgi:hypothetical protein